MAHVIAVIGCGNVNRSDDGAGPEVVRALSHRAIAQDSRIKLLDAATDGMAVMFAARNCASLILVDACRSGATPGAVFEVPGAELACRHPPAMSLHDFRWDHALFAGRRLFAAAFPVDVSVLLIEAETTALGIGLSAPVARAAAAVADRVESRLRECLQEVALCR